MPGTWDVLIMLIYLKIRWFDSVWRFWPMFEDIYWKRHLDYIDAIGLYYICLGLYHLFRWIKRFSTNTAKEYKEGFLNPDLPIHVLAENGKTNVYQLDRDGLNRNKFARQVASTISITNVTRAYAIGICGPWGSGKTSLISLVVQNLKDRGEKRFLFIEFSPWFFSSTESLINNFFSTIRENFRLNKTLYTELGSYARSIVMAEKSLLNTEWSKLIFEEHTGLQERYANVVREIKNEKRILIIAIDDLDRLDKKEVLDVLRLIRLMADFPNTFYIVGYDKNYINSAIKQTLTDHEPDKYANKIFNLEIKIPPLVPDIVRERLKLQLENQIRILDSGIQLMHADELERCYDFMLSVSIITTERDIKRFNNNLLMRYLSVKGEINFYHFFLLELINFSNQDLFNSIFKEKDKLLRNSKKSIGLTAEPPDYDSIFNRECSADEKNVLSELFSRDSYQMKYAISKELYFYRYFSLTLLKNDFSDEEFDKAFEAPYDQLKNKLSEFFYGNEQLLADKLFKKFGNNQLAADATFSKCLKAFLFLYWLLFESGSTENIGLTINNLGAFVLKFIEKSGASLNMIQDTLSGLETDYLESTGYLISLNNPARQENLDLFEPREEKLAVIRKLELEFLHRMLAASSGKMNRQIIRQFEYLCEFVTDNRFREQELDWYTEQVIKPFATMLVDGSEEIINYVKPRALINNQFSVDLAKPLIENIFPDFDNHLQFYLNLGLERISDLYDGFETKNIFSYTFSNQKPIDAGHPEFTDMAMQETFELTKGLKISIDLEPHNTPFWRFGFRLAVSKYFPLVESARHVDGYPFIQLNKGAIDDQTHTWRDQSPPRLDLGVYSGSSLDSVEELISPYFNGKIKLDFYVDKLKKIRIGVTEGTNEIEAKLITQFDNFTYLKIYAWYDGHAFNISARIKLLQQLNPSKLL
ncbi:MAG TPA: P-loop NTPase fold protein [Puia sp.]|nr:P-loop NTPase fold protein [Puia sp.]